MLKVKIHTIGKDKESWLTEGVAEYEKRLRGRIEIEWTLAKDNDGLIKNLGKEPSFIALDPKGELLSSEQFSEKLFSFGARLCLTIGGAEGLPLLLKQKAKWLWSLSPLTFTHQMTRLIVLEQLYRASEIDRGSPYHK